MAPRQTSAHLSLDRRRLPRVHLGGTTGMPVSSDGDALMLADLSYAGCAIESRQPLHPGDEWYLTFTLDTCLSFIVPVRVVYSRPAHRERRPGFRYVVGLEFQPSKQPDIHRVVEILLEACHDIESPSVH